jgi:hypothetical protein
MKRLLLCPLLAGLVLALARPAGAQDTVIYLNRATGKEDRVVGTIEAESPRGITIKARKAAQTVLAADVRQVVYRHPKVTALEFRAPFAKETRALQASRPANRRTLLDEALKGFQDLDAQMRDAPLAHRYLQFKMGEVLALEAQDDPSRLDAAIAALTAYKNDFATGWEITSALKQLARLQEDRGDAVAAGKTYEELAAVPDVPEQVKRESAILVARMLLRGGKYGEAERKLAQLRTTLSENDPQRAHLDVYLAQSRLAQGHPEKVEGELREAIRGSSDPNLKAAAYNALGDYYRQEKRPEDAFWQYLRVDTLYNQDREEEAKALFYLRTLFDKVKNDPVRARECARRLMEQRFAGSAYQKQVQGEGK